MQSLKDKLVEAGLVAEDHRPGESPEQRSQRLNREQAEKRTRIAEVVASSRVATAMGSHTFFFTTRSRKMRRLMLDDEARTSLEKGQTAVVEWPNRPDFPWAVVPRAAAERILKIDRDAVRFFLKSETERYGIEPDPEP